MAIYRNDYSKEEDETLWEIHEIRHRLHFIRKEKGNEKINKEAESILNNHQQIRSEDH